MYCFVEPASHRCLSAGADWLARGQVQTQYFGRQSGQLRDSGLHYIQIDRGVDLVDLLQILGMMARYHTDQVPSSPDSTECSDNLQSMLSLCEHINAPVKTSKIEGPSTRLTFLGIVIDTGNMTAGISQERKQDLLSSLKSLRKKQMHKTPTTFLGWKVILCLQSGPGGEDISSSSHRS